ncbi:MAG TPA: hypothetical protein VF053_14570 [Streptosporangiales bacterium]
MAHPVVFLLAMAFAVALLVVAFVVRRPIQHALYPDTGLKEWQATARRLSRSDRWRIYRAVSRGRAVAPRLAPFAVQRARMVLAVLDTMRRRRYLWWLVGFEAMFVALVLANAVNLFGYARGDHPSSVFLFCSVVLVVYFGVTAAVMPFVLRLTERRARDAVRVNLAQQGELPDLRRADQEPW